MRDLKRGPVLLAFLPALLAMLVLSNAGSSFAASTRLAAQQGPAIELLVSVSPPNVEPGQKAIVNVTLRNLSGGPIAPEVLIYLPSSVTARLDELPAGTFYNAQSSAVNWQPVMGGNGTEIQLSLPVVAQVADPHAPEQRVSVVVAAGGQEIEQDTQLWVGLAPVATITLRPPQVAVGQPIQLVGEVTGSSGPVAQIWSLGDGRIVEAENPSVIYPFPGAYEVIFQASTPMGVISQKVTLNVVAQTIARFTISDNTLGVGAPVQFSNESGGQQPLNYLWDFGDGSISTDVHPDHIYQVPGTYDVRLFVTGANGQSETAQTVRVGAVPVADFVIGDVVDAGVVIQGQAFADDSVTSITWDMGDGRTYEGPVIEHVYWATGEHPVTVTATNEFGETRMMRSVRVNPGPLFLYLPLVQNGIEEEVVPEVMRVAPDAVGVAPDAVGVAPSAVEIPSDQPSSQVDEMVQDELQVLDLPADLTPQELLLAYINEARRVNGLAALSPMPQLNAAAQRHADDMAVNSLTGHTGSDGSVPALRVLLSGYSGGYAGEATAWGMAQAVEPVRYWLSSPGHREIILNPAAKDVGVGFSENYEAPSVWYWAADFASPDLPVVRVPLPASMTPVPDPVITLLGPPTNGEFVLAADTKLIFTWSWPTPLSADERFAIYLNSQGRTIQIGTVNEAQADDQYQFVTSAGNVPALPGQQSWYVSLESTVSGEMREQSEAREILFLSNP